VAELLVLVHTTHQHRISYALLQHQSYWFADVIYNAAKKRCGKVKETVLKHSIAPGNFGMVQVIRTRGETVSEVLQKHEEAWATADDGIRDISLVGFDLPSRVHLSEV
jgi:hypothetical protein